jgi:hypothetical protein
VAAPTALSDALSQLLGAAMTILGANTPPLTYVAASRPAFDCPMLVAYCEGFGPATSTTQTAHPRQSPRAATYEAQLGLVITRCAPQMSESGSPPTPAEYSVFASALLADVYELESGIFQMLRAGALYAGCRYKTVGQAAPIDETGGQAGWLIPVNVDLDGITH